MKYGYIGLGNLGGHLAYNLVKAGFPMVVTDLNRENAERHLAAGAKWAATPQALASEVDCVITCLPSPKVSRFVLDQILPVMKPGATWIEMSTLGRADICALAEHAAHHRIQTLACPVTGGVHLAAQGKITVLVGGEQELFEKHKAALEVMGDQIFHLGKIGSEAVVKVITNMLAFIHLLSCGEALMLAKRGGVDLAQAYHAIAASSGTSFVHETEGQLILNGSYDIAFTMDLALKDLGFAMDYGREFGVPLNLAALTQQTFITGAATYGRDAQSTQIVKLLEDALGTDLRAPGFPARLE